MKISLPNPIHIVKKSQSSGVEYVDFKVLKKSARTVTRAHFWRIPHNSGQSEVALKIGRYKYTENGDEIEIQDPKSELTLDDQELKELASYLQQNYEPLRDGAAQYILVEENISRETANKLKAFFNKPNKDAILSIIIENDILPDHLLQGLQHQKRVQEIKAYKNLLDQSADENKWQKWFTDNSWVLGSEFIRILDDRRIDTDNVADFLVQAYDGFLDIIEIKKPDTTQEFWSSKKYRDNYIPSQELIGTITQATNYIYAVEREANSQKFLERVGWVRVAKPRGILIFGRSKGWNKEQCEAFRLLNASYHNLTIMTYDHVLERANRMLGLPEVNAKSEDDPMPF